MSMAIIAQTSRNAFTSRHRGSGSGRARQTVGRIAFALTCCLVAASHGQVARGQSTSVPVPISYYTFDQPAGSTTLLDSVRGTSGQGTLYGYGGGGGTFAPGLVGNALSFNGSTTYVTAPLVGAALSEFTLSAWVNLTEATNWGTILKNWGSSTPGAFHLGIQDNSSQWSNFVGLADDSVAAVYTPNDTTPTGTWTNLITTVSSSAGQMKLYLNGLLVDTTSFSGEINGTKPVMSFGVKLNDQNDGAGDPPGWLNGWLDEIAFWDSALTSQQVGNIYSSGTSGSSPIPVPSSTVYWAPGAGAGGTDTWTAGVGSFWAANANGSGTKAVWNNGLANGEAVFGGTPGTVTTSGTIEANKLTFTTNGYTIAGNATSPIQFIGSAPGIKLASGVSTTISADLGGSGPLAVTGTGSRGVANLGGVVTTTDGVQVTNALLSLSGTVNGSVSVAANAAVGGTGLISGTISGSGAVAPGNSPGILTVNAVDPTGGLDFTFEFSGTAPNYANASASVNDVLRLNGSTPFGTGLTGANTKTLFLNFTKAALTVGTGTATILQGGFFTDADTDFLSLINNATSDNAGFAVYVLGDGNGTDNYYNGQSYYNWRNPAMFGWTQSLFASTEVATGAFAGGSSTGRVLTLAVAVPEPATCVMALAGLACGGFLMWRRRKRA